MIDAQTFALQKSPRFGAANPTRMDCAFWIHMVRTGDWACAARKMFGPQEEACAEGPVWCFNRFGASRTPLADGRTVCIGGEHEDFYDPDFCIYNDVVVLGPEAQVEIYGYPKSVFPPTDFHSATLIDNRIFIIGCLGYMNERRPGYTPVYALDLSCYTISAILTTGEMPGWLFKHEAILGPQGIITVRGGEVVADLDPKCGLRKNLEDYALDTRSGIWRRVTNRNWPQFVIRGEDARAFDWLLKAEDLLPREFKPAIPSDEDRLVSFVVNGITVSLEIRHSQSVQIIVQGALANDLARRLTEQVRANLQSAIGRKCIIEPG